MSANRQTVVGVIFGGRSVEHDVSVVTGHQVMRAFDPARYRVIPIYIDRDGRWFTGLALNDLKTFQTDVASLAGVQSCILSPAVQHHGLIVEPGKGKLFAKTEIVKLDVVFPAIHGSHGEDGTLQGLLELADIPYVGCGVLASAVANDKMLTKSVMKANGIPVVDAIAFTRHDWEQKPEAILAEIAAALEFPVFIKPITLGSSIGIGRATDETMLRAYIDVATNLDRRVLVESGVGDSIEINCAVIGDDRDLQASVLEQPLGWADFLSYEDKYLRGDEGMKSAQRLLPAPISPELTATIQAMTLAAFRAIDGRGTARLDFLVRPDKGEIYLNEINTMPGSVAFYLWQHMGMTPGAVVDRLVVVARAAAADKRRNTYNYKTNLIALTAARGLKGMKGTKSAVKPRG
ncbi:MAG: D-alanine--D-alanine ligase family protein [Chloroflexota bacterium]|nr:D-alanine--D-alanine ligase family protein [Chloroflexota bacterium]